jgi:hypothetical protein
VFFPLDEQLGLEHNGLSPGLAQQAVWLSSLLPYERAEEVLERIGGYQLPATTLWEHTQQVGEAWRKAEESAQVSVERTRWESRDYAPHARRSVSMDGGMVHIRAEGWKEVKVGVIGTFAAPWETHPTRENRSQHLHYTAHLGSVDEFAAKLWRLAVAQQVPTAGHVVITADGAPWIWRLVADLFPCSTQIVDWYHACQQLSSLAQTRFPTHPQQALQWCKHLQDHLWQGECWQVIAQLQAANLNPRYFIQHQRRMNYPDFQAQAYPIGSGTTESGVKQYKHRLCGTGMRWSRSGAERMLVLRSAVMDGSFHHRWRAA